jgi:hypothetical protein
MAGNIIQFRPRDEKPAPIDEIDDAIWFIDKWIPALERVKHLAPKRVHHAQESLILAKQSLVQAQIGAGAGE